jgi:hypothetical protein
MLMVMVVMMMMVMMLVLLQSRMLSAMVRISAYAPHYSVTLLRPKSFPSSACQVTYKSFV